MTELQYRNRSISQLVNQLNSLGEAQVVLEPLRLLAIHEHDHESLKRFKNSHGQQFFTIPNNDKRYVYDEISQTLTPSQFSLMQDLYGRGFNVSMVVTLPKEQNKVMQLWGQISRLIGQGAYCALGYHEQLMVDLVSEERLTERDAESRAKYYKVKDNNSIAFLDRIVRDSSQPKSSIFMVKIRKIVKDQPLNNQITLVVLPQQLFSPQLKANDYLTMVRSQLTQIFNFIKLNPAKKYQHFSKLLTKRLPITNAVAALLLEQSMCVVINWVNEGSHLPERLAFYDKLRGLTALLKVEETRKVTVIDLPFELGSASRKEQGRSRVAKPSKTERTPVAQLLSEENQFEFCRSFERKTHKYSIHGSHQEAEELDNQQLFSNKLRPSRPSQPSQFKLTTNQHSPSPGTHRSDHMKKDVLFDQTMPRQKPLVATDLNESQQIAILKAQHAVQISQYHHTIQQLNKKILALTHQNHLEELYTIHERELMLLELKIKQLRNDITMLTDNGDEKSYKSMVRKLNEQVKRLENSNAQKKVTGGKVVTLEKQLQEIKNKYDQSEKARKKMAYELQYLTKRLKICDAQIDHLNKRQQTIPNTGSPTVNTAKLSISDIQSLRQIEVLLNEAKQGNDQAAKFLMRKMTNVLEDLSSSRNIILECNDFLVQLEQHLQEKIGGKEPQIVLDCNKFIRSFLMDNLNIF